MSARRFKPVSFALPLASQSFITFASNVDPELGQWAKERLGEGFSLADVDRNMNNLMTPAERGRMAEFRNR